MTIGVSRIFKSTDAGAPQFSETLGTITTMLKTVLVDGYGATAPLGWDAPYTGTNKLVVRARYGTRQFIRFDDTIHLSWMGVSAFSTMSSVDQGIDRMPAIGTTYYWNKRYSSGSTNVPWIIIGDEIGFYLMLKFFYPAYSGTNVLGSIWIGGYVGDYTPWNIANKWNFIIATCDNTSGEAYAGVLGPLAATNSAIIAKRGATLLKGLKRVYLLPFNSNSIFGQNNPVLGSLSAGQQLLNGTYMHSAVHIYDTVPAVGDCILGNMPGLFEPIGKNSGAAGTYAGFQAQNIEYIDSNGILNLYMIFNNGTSTTENAVHRLIFKVGPGFRNVQ
ncbi:hypothetical protein JZU46_02930 [bacterium]|nr:hypothetical protein [bacterium]